MLEDCFDLSLILKQDSESGRLLPWDGTIVKYCILYKQNPKYNALEQF